MTLDICTLLLCTSDTWVKRDKTIPDVPTYTTSRNYTAFYARFSHSSRRLLQRSPLPSFYEEERVLRTKYLIYPFHLTAILLDHDNQSRTRSAYPSSKPSTIALAFISLWGFIDTMWRWWVCFGGHTEAVSRTVFYVPTLLGRRFMYIINFQRFSFIWWFHQRKESKLCHTSCHCRVDKALHSARWNFKPLLLDGTNQQVSDRWSIVHFLRRSTFTDSHFLASFISSGFVKSTV